MARRHLALVGAGVGASAALAVVVTLAFVRGDDGDADVRARTASSTAPTSTATTSPPAPRYTQVEDFTRPADPAALRAVLDELDFPAWWWTPEQVATDDELPTVRLLLARDELVNDGVSTGAARRRATTWWLPGADPVATEAAVLAALPADLYDVATAERTVTSGSDATRIRYGMPGRAAAEGSYLTVTVTEQPGFTGPGNPVPAGVEVGLDAAEQIGRPSAAVPVGEDVLRQFLAGAPTSPDLAWLSAELQVTTEAGPRPDSGSYRATFTAPSERLDDVVAFLADPATFTGALQPVQQGRFRSDVEWEQPMAYDGFLGRYEILKSSSATTDRLFVHLEFPLV